MNFGGIKTMKFTLTSSCVGLIYSLILLFGNVPIFHGYTSVVLLILACIALIDLNTLVTVPANVKVNAFKTGITSSFSSSCFIMAVIIRITGGG